MNSEPVSLDTIPDPLAVRPTYVDGDGYVVDAETGEVLGRADVAAKFEVRTREDADWTLRLRSEIEGDIAGIDARLRAMTEHLLAQRAAQVRRLSWWEWRFRPSLVEFARSCLKGKSRTAQFDWGRVSFRATKGTRQIVDMQAAVEYVQAFAPEKVKVVRTVNLEAVDAARREAERAAGEPEVGLAFLAEGGPGESVTVSTGVEVKGGE